MPVGIQRLNAKKTQPNDRVVFIKPLKGKDEAIAQDFLERIAAQCLPIMKEHHLSVTTLEEYEPNREFVGRNFNGGEIIQLVLKARSGHWLPFNYVQMVMMHELAHCVQMNHSRAFWKVRNLYADQMRTLWGRAYTGEGIWGRGALLATGEFENNTVPEGDELPEHLCGGTYRSRRRKRGRKAGGAELTYQEKKQRRIEKKFGKDGVALGADDDVKAKLEKGKRTQATPRVAGSNRGRELRAAAALARFEDKKKEPTPEDDDGNGESAYEDAEDIDPSADDALDIDGKELLDTRGNRMVKVCEDENPDDEDAANELKELQSSITTYFSPRKRTDDATRKSTISDVGPITTAQIRGRSPNRRTDDAATTAAQDAGTKDRLTSSMTKDTAEPLILGTSRPGKSNAHAASDRTPAPSGENTACPVCSFENEAYTVTCSMCSNVLNPDSVPGTWKCHSSSCQDGIYLNAGDCGTCGICGQRRGEMN